MYIKYGPVEFKVAICTDLMFVSINVCKTTVSFNLINSAIIFTNKI